MPLTNPITAVITGANGFIGSHVTTQLLARGESVYALGRAKGAQCWGDRVKASLADIGATPPVAGQLFCHQIDISDPNLEFDFPSEAPGSQATLFHLAGDTRFVPPDPAAQRRTNIDSALNLIQRLKGRIAKVVHVSTAYVAGNRAQRIRENELEAGQGFHNAYEESKFDAEIAVTKLCAAEQIPLVIVRPSIIINDRRTGRASTFTHLNVLIDVLCRVQRHYGISDGEVVNSTLRLLGDPEARPNLAPVDSIVPPLIQIAQSPAAVGRVFHLSHPAPQSNFEIVNLISNAFKVSGKISLEFVKNVPRPTTFTEQILLRSLKVYAPYMNSRCEFDLANSRSIVPDYDSYFTQLDQAYIQKVIGFQRGSV